MLNRARTAALAVLSVLGLALSGAPAAAQSDILLQLRSGIPAGDRFRVDSAGGVVAIGQITLGIIPASGAGYRMMWHPAKVGFRAGEASAAGEFDDGNIGYYSWAGGRYNIAAGQFSFAFGNLNTVEQSAQCGIAMGSGNKVWGSGGSIGTCGVALGLNNDVLDQAGVALGNNNWSDGDGAVALGQNSTADADYSMAFGYRASTNGHTGAKIFSDASTTDSLQAGANNEFAVRAAGGYRLRTNATLSNGCNMSAGGTSWICSSSRALKQNFVPADGEDVLRRMRRVPVNYWNVTEEASGALHLGPFSEDFADAFGLGDERKAIGLQDIDGVNFAAIRGLDDRTEAMRAQTRALQGEVQTLRAEVAALREQAARDAAARAETERRLARLEALLKQP